MIKTIIATVIAYMASSIDEIPVLFLLYTKTENRSKGKIITFSFFIGTFILICLGLLGAFGLGQIPVKWMIGLIGIIPFFMGVKTLLTGEVEDEEKALISAGKFKPKWLQIIAVTISLGVDDIGIYIPLFTTLKGIEIFIMLIIVFLETSLLCYISWQLARIDKLAALIKAYERYINGIIFLIIGIYVMVECGTLDKIAALFFK